MLRNLLSVRVQSRSLMPTLQCARRSYATPTPELLEERDKKLNELNVNTVLLQFFLLLYLR